MEALFKKYFWLIKLLGICVVVGFIASAAVNSIGSRKLLEPATEAGSAELEQDEAGETEGDEDEEDTRERQSKMLEKLSGTPSSSTQRKTAAADAVVAGSIFCPTCMPPAPTPEQLAAAAPTSTGAPVRPGEIPSRLPLQLLATMESDDPAYSMATILHTDSNTLSAYSPNDTIRAGVVVQRVERGKVVMRNGAQLEYLQIGAAAPPPPPATAAAKPEEEQPAPNDREIEGAAEAISCDESFTNCTVDKAFVEKLMANPAQLTKQARIVPSVRDGETTGYKFYGIRPGSLPKLLGLKNGDLLTSVNGHELESLDQAMDLYNKLRRASHLSVTIERKGKVMQKEIDIK